MRASTRLIPILSVTVALACRGSEPPALSVGAVEFPERALLGLGEERRSELARLAAFGLAVADSARAELGRPVTEGWTEDRLLDILAAERVLRDAAVGNDVLEAHYLVDPRYELTVRHILFFSERWRDAAHRAEARGKAERALERVRSGADFAETAARLSEEPGAEGRQGLLTPGREGAWVDEFWAAASALDVGEISSVTETQYGFHVLRLEDRRAVPFEEARPAVVRSVARRVGDTQVHLDAWRDPEARRAAIAEARAQGLSVPPEESDEIARRWNDLTARWAAALGFRVGIDAEAVGRAALEALGRTTQGADIARRELSRYADLLDAAYEVARATGS